MFFAHRNPDEFLATAIWNLKYFNLKYYRDPIPGETSEKNLFFCVTFHNTNRIYLYRELHKKEHNKIIQKKFCFDVTIIPVMEYNI